ncbi:hypothetical protein L7F22_016951 [Adiantum nelumboides]|nr:hypothetical protein [Adiantum nelumboides]
MSIQADSKVVEHGKVNPECFLLCFLKHHMVPSAALSFFSPLIFVFWPGWEPYFLSKILTSKHCRSQQVYSLCYTDVLLPALGTSVPAPVVLFVINCSFQILFKSSGSKTGDSSTSSIQLMASSEPGSVPLVAATTQVSSVPSKPKDLINVFCETRILSLSDDGRLWHWSVLSGCANDCRLQSTHLKGTIQGCSSLISDGTRDAEIGSHDPLPPKLDSKSSTSTFKLMLTGQLSLLPSLITTLAVPVPSMLAITPGGGNGPAVSVPLVALATQGGTIELVDAMSNSITSSFLVHSSSVRGLRWLGNSRLVSFSYTEIKGKGGGFVNALAVTCVRSGQSKPFRTLQKPERAPVRALRTSPSGRYLLILFREAPAEVWAMTKNPQMVRSFSF